MLETACSHAATAGLTGRAGSGGLGSRGACRGRKSDGMAAPSGRGRNQKPTVPGVEMTNKFRG